MIGAHWSMSNLSNISDHAHMCWHSFVTCEQQVRHVSWKISICESRIAVAEMQNMEGGEFRFKASTF